MKRLGVPQLLRNDACLGWTLGVRTHRVDVLPEPAHENTVLRAGFFRVLEGRYDVLLRLTRNAGAGIVFGGIPKLLSMVIPRVALFQGNGVQPLGSLPFDDVKKLEPLS